MADYYFDTLNDLHSFWKRKRGYLLNRYKNCLHKISCETYRNHPSSAPGLTYTRQGFDTWADVLRVLGPQGSKWYPCSVCNPDESVNTTFNPISADHAEEAIVPPASISINVPASSHDSRLHPNSHLPFTEHKVEGALVPWLESRGYRVSMKVRVSNGVIDIVASGEDGRWIIEAKGEDRGGYTSAEMNFQMGIGQIVSRMSEPTTNYALAIPLTPDFRKVLRKFRGTVGFAMLGLTLFVIEVTGTVHRVKPMDVSQYLDVHQ